MLYVCIRFRKTWRSSGTHMTLRAQSMCNNDSARTVCTLQSAYSRTLKHYTPLTPDPPPPLINIVFVVLNFV